MKDNNIFEFKDASGKINKIELNTYDMQKVVNYYYEYLTFEYVNENFNIYASSEHEFKNDKQFTLLTGISLDNFCKNLYSYILDNYDTNYVNNEMIEEYCSKNHIMKMPKALDNDINEKISEIINKEYSKKTNHDYRAAIIFPDILEMEKRTLSFYLFSQSKEINSETGFTDMYQYGKGNVKIDNNNKNNKYTITKYPDDMSIEPIKNKKNKEKSR